MAVEFYSLVFANIGEMYTDTSDPFGRVKVRLYFHNVGTDIYTPIEIDIKIKYCPHESALAEVKKVIAAAHALLSECDLRELQTLSVERMQRSD